MDPSSPYFGFWGSQHESYPRPIKLLDNVQLWLEDAHSTKILSGIYSVALMRVEVTKAIGALNFVVVFAKQY